MMPNFITYEVPSVSEKQEVFQEKPKLSVFGLSEEEAIEFGELMKQSFIEHWRKKKFQVYPLTEKECYK